MIKIAVVSYDNEAPTLPTFALFGSELGSIGRSEDSLFVLNDPKHLISRSQALVRSDGRKHFLTNVSHACPVSINGRDIEPERECELRPGDQIQIGLYQLGVEVDAESERLDATFAGTLPVAADKIENPESTPTDAELPLPIEAAAPPTTTEAQIENETVAPDELLQAFLHGAGLDSLHLSSGLTVEVMETIGQLLANSIQGTMDLIAQRALVKREVKAEVTMVVVRKNNPLKFFPESQTVLTQMLRKKMPGFMAPAEAIADAYLDLRAHQFGVVAGMKASKQAKDTFLEKLHPTNFEKGLAEPGFLDSLNPARRKALMWDRFSTTFGQISTEAYDEFHTLFGKDFLRAYEHEVERVKDEGAASAAS